MKMILYWIGYELDSGEFRYVDGPFGYKAAALEALKETRECEIRITEHEVQ